MHKGEVLVFALALALIMLHLEHEPQSVKPSMQWLLHLVVSRESYALLPIDAGEDGLAAVTDSVPSVRSASQ